MSRIRRENTVAAVPPIAPFLIDIAQADLDDLKARRARPRDGAE